MFSTKFCHNARQLFALWSSSEKKRRDKSIMNLAYKIGDLTESLAMEASTVKVSITPETRKRKKSQKSDLGDIEKEFWPEWSAIGDQFYGCCLKLMNFNPTIAEDALSRAMLHSWEKVQNYVGKIGNLKRAIALLTSPEGKKRSPLKSSLYPTQRPDKSAAQRPKFPTTAGYLLGLPQQYR